MFTYVVKLTCTETWCVLCNKYAVCYFAIQRQVACFTLWLSSCTASESDEQRFSRYVFTVYLVEVQLSFSLCHSFVEFSTSFGKINGDFIQSRRWLEILQVLNWLDRKLWMNCMTVLYVRVGQTADTEHIVHKGSYRPWKVLEKA